MNSTHRGATDPVGADLLRLLKTLKLGAMADTLLAQSAIDRLTSAAHTLVIEGPSYRQRTRAQLDPDPADEHPQ